MNEAELLKKVAKETITVRPDIKEIIDTYIECIWEELVKGNQVKIRNLGTFTKTTKKAHKARNPRTGEEVMVPEKKTIKFKPSPNFIKILNDPHSDL